MPGSSLLVTASASVPIVPTQRAVPVCDAPSTIAAGVIGSQPRATSRAAISARVAIAIRNTSVALRGASESTIGAYADGAWPDATTNAADRPRWVTGTPASAG